ncbi:MAG: hypothetical protein ABIL09_14935 [Gemmatimonadota bacterium]
MSCASAPPAAGPLRVSPDNPRFDLSRHDPAYFDRLRQRVARAGERGIYVSIMLFEGHGLHASEAPWCWDGHPMNVHNNVNESGAYSTTWQYHLIDFIHARERTLPSQHPVGMTFQYCGDRAQRGTNATLFASPADWISPNPEGGYTDDPPPADGSKVIFTDTDHLWGIGGNHGWVWKSFCRGLNPLFMDPCSPPIESRGPAGQTSPWTDHLTGLSRLDPQWDPLRHALGQTRRLAERMDLRRAVPHGELASTGYCLADPGTEYAVYLPVGGVVTVDLSAARGRLRAEWIDPTGGEALAATVEGGARRTLRSPAAGDVALYLRAER